MTDAMTPEEFMTAVVKMQDRLLTSANTGMTGRRRPEDGWKLEQTGGQALPWRLLLPDPHVPGATRPYGITKLDMDDGILVAERLVEWHTEMAVSEGARDMHWAFTGQGARRRLMVDAVADNMLAHLGIPWSDVIAAVAAELVDPSNPERKRMTDQRMGKRLSTGSGDVKAMTQYYSGRYKSRSLNRLNSAVSAIFLKNSSGFPDFILDLVNQNHGQTMNMDIALGKGVMWHSEGRTVTIRNSMPETVMKGVIGMEAGALIDSPAFATGGFAVTRALRFGDTTHLHIEERRVDIGSRIRPI